MREDDVEGEEGGIGEGKRESDGLTCEPDIGEQIHTRDRERESDGIPRRTSPYGGQGDDREELDRRDRPERQPFDRKVEARVHGGEDDCEVDDGLSVGALCGGERAPRSSPEGEDRRGARDPKPGDTEWLDPGEEQDGERRTEVVEDRAPHEEHLRRRSGRAARDRLTNVAPRPYRQHAGIVAAGMS